MAHTNIIVRGLGLALILGTGIQAHNVLYTLTPSLSDKASEIGALAFVFLVGGWLAYVGENIFKKKSGDRESVK